MLTGDIRNQIDGIWNTFWTGGISNPLEVIEQITYLLFLKRLDDLHTLEENKARATKKPMERRVFPEGKDTKGRAFDDFRWSRFKHFAPADLFAVVNDHVFPFLRTLGGEESTYATHMKDARFTIPSPALLAKVVDLIDHIPMEDRDTKGDLYEYMLGKIAAAGRPLLPIVVVRGDNNMPGGGLFKYAKRKKLQKGDDLTFFATELRRVYDYWAAAAPPAPKEPG